jgi:hypothetical protein
MIESASRCEDQVADELGALLSDAHSGKAERQRAYRAWSYNQARDVETYEREVSDVAKSAVSAIGKPGPQAPTVIAPPRDMRMPRTIEEAINCPAYGTQWSQAVADEIAGLAAKKCYQAVEMKEFMKPLLALKPVFKVKFNADGTIDKFKCRLVVGGHKAIKGHHFDETYSPVLSLVILRLILSMFPGWPHVITTVADAVQAYLNSKLLEEVHVWAPKGIRVPPGYVLKLLKAIYGMPQGGREYWKLIRSVILGLGFTQSDHAPCFFYRRTDAGFIIVMTYVDDMTITTDNELMRNEVFDAINSVVEVKDLGVIASFWRCSSSTTSSCATGISPKAPTSRTCAPRWA